MPIAEAVGSPVALSVCQLSCGQGGALWPKPTGHLSLGNSVVPLDLDNIELTGISAQTVAGNLLRRNVERLRENARKLDSFASHARKGGFGLLISIDEGLNVTDAKLTLDTDESYTLRVAQIDRRVRPRVEILARLL